MWIWQNIICWKRHAQISGAFSCEKTLRWRRKKTITPQDLRDKPLILSQQEYRGGGLTRWIGREPAKLNITATYNLLFNASLLVDEGLGYAIGFDKIINTAGESNLCFRPLENQVTAGMDLVWKKYQVFSKAAEKFLEAVREQMESWDT